MTSTAEQLPKQEAYSQRADTIRRLGGQALDSAGIAVEKLGINDPLTHLDEYLRGGEAMLPHITENIITYVAEKLTKPKFVNSVELTFIDDDFISRHGSFSMRAITEIALDKAQTHQLNEQERRRAEIEANEVSRLVEWFKLAERGEVFVVESMPLGQYEEYAITRIYEKIGETDLTESVISLHNPSLAVFDQTRSRLGVSRISQQDELALLDEMYSLKPSSQDFVSHYVNQYDQAQSVLQSGQYIFGIPTADRQHFQDDMQLVRRQASLVNIFNDALKSLKSANWVATPDLVGFCNKLKVDTDIVVGASFSTDQARDILDSALQYIISTIDRAPEEVLAQLSSGVSSGVVYEVAGNFGAQTKLEGKRYQGGPCPESIQSMRGSQLQSANSEFSIMNFSQTAKKLEQKKHGKGACVACGQQGILYGCGVFCRGCNQTWCDAYRKGRQLSAAEVASRRRTKTKRQGEGVLKWWIEWNQKYKMEQAAKKQKNLAQTK